MSGSDWQVFLMFLYRMSLFPVAAWEVSLNKFPSAAEAYNSGKKTCVLPSWDVLWVWLSLF